MKKLLLTICALSALTFSGFAQGARKAQPATQQAQQTPEERATKETNMVAANLGLTDAQKTKFKQFALDRIAINKPLKEKIRNSSTTKEERTTIHNQVKANNDKFFANVNAMLTAEQQPKWADHKKKVEAKQADKAGNNHED